MEREEEIEGQDDGEPLALPFLTNSKSVQDSVFSSMRTERTEQVKIVKPEKVIDQERDNKGDQPESSGEVVTYTVHWMIHTMAG